MRYKKRVFYDFLSKLCILIIKYNELQLNLIPEYSFDLINCLFLQDIADNIYYSIIKS